MRKRISSEELAQVNDLIELLNEALYKEDWERFIWILEEEVRDRGICWLSAHNGNHRIALLEELSKGKSANFHVVAGLLVNLGLQISVQPDGSEP